MATKLSRSACEPIAALLVIESFAAVMAVSRAVSTRLPCWKRKLSSQVLYSSAQLNVGYARNVSKFSDTRMVFGRGKLTFMTAALSVSTLARVACILRLVAFQIATMSGLTRYCRSIAKRVTLASLAFARGSKLKRAVSSART